MSAARWPVLPPDAQHRLWAHCWANLARKVWAEHERGAASMMQPDAQAEGPAALDRGTDAPGEQEAPPRVASTVPGREDE